MTSLSKQSEKSNPRVRKAALISDRCLARANITADTPSWFFALPTAIPQGLYSIPDLCGVGADIPFRNEGVFKLIVHCIDGARDDTIGSERLGSWLQHSGYFSDSAPIRRQGFTILQQRLRGYALFQTWEAARG
ncbi:MAG: hypothetical protein WBL70_02395 [Candidatus Acidiferrales bacterium]